MTVCAITAHCAGRFFERFGDDEDLAASLARSVAVSFRRACCLSHGSYIRQSWDYRYDSTLDALFAVGRRGVVVTVLFARRCSDG